jgi:hypothetical protein
MDRRKVLRRASGIAVAGTAAHWLGAALPPVAA